MEPFHVLDDGGLADDVFALREQADLLEQLGDRTRELGAMQHEHRWWLADRFPDLAAGDSAVDPMAIDFAEEGSLDTDASDFIAVMDQLPSENPFRRDVPGELLDKQHELRDRWVAEVRRDLMPTQADQELTIYEDEPDPVLLSHPRVIASDTVRRFTWRSFQPFPGGANVSGKQIHRNQNEVGQFSRNGSMRGSGVPLMLANTVHRFTPRWLAVMGTTSLTGHLELWAELEYDTAHYSSFIAGQPGGPDLAMVSASSFFTFFGAPGASPNLRATARLWTDETEWFRFSSNRLFTGKVSHHPRSKPIWVHLRSLRPETIRFDGSPSTIRFFDIGLVDALSVSDPRTTISYVSARSRWKLNKVVVNLVR